MFTKCVVCAFQGSNMKDSDGTSLTIEPVGLAIGVRACPIAAIGGFLSFLLRTKLYGERVVAM
ncbi:Tudor/PWWP/MBT superfamily protein [Zea mays]|jgi:hypothetical protein|uniref:Tudor/PWWP/MBT superfamily protein n=1 Tax=Zea mays TaxID=4577 RepID=A0A1D6FUK4_MAIZE|nr:Tudor/PWWP/MBT superfamily protein [Zea mays]